MSKTEITPKPKKNKSFIRTEAVIPFIIVVAVTVLYFHFFFDHHLKKAFEFAGYQLLGAEVDIDSVETSFFKGTFRAQGIQVTNAEKPTHNMVNIGDVRFGVLWDALLKARMVVKEMAVEQIEIDTPRKTPGKVKPPEVDKSDPNAPSALDKVKDKALGAVETKYNNNVLGDLAAALGGTSGNDQMGKIEGSLPSKAKLKELEAEYQTKQKKWQEKIQALPKGPEIQALGDRLSKVKTKDFKTPQELQQSLQAIDTILKEAAAKYKTAQSTGNDLSSDLKNFDQEVKALDAMVKKDIQDLEARFHIPKLDAKSISESIFMSYLSPYISQFNRYKKIVEKYAPPNLMKNDKPKEAGAEPDPEIQARPRALGITYEFSHPRSYPLFWIKKISISSQAGANPHSGNIKGQVTDVTSNQVLTGKPTEVQIQGDFPGLQVSDFLAHASIDNTKELSLVGFDFKVGSYAITGKELVKSPDLQIAFQKANGALTSKGQLLGLKDFSFTLNNQFKNVEYQVQSKNAAAEEIIKSVFAGLPTISLDADGKGQLPSLALNINSNLGPELGKGFEKQLQKKLAEARAKLQTYVNDQIGTEKAKFEAEINKSKSQIEGEVKKAQDQLNKQKELGDSKVNQAKKDAENQGRKQVESEAKKALGPDADKKVDELKKRFGL